MRSVEEILATLGDRGSLDAHPFMPEMLRYCGRRFRVVKSAYKTGDTILTSRNRRMKNAVHLEGSAATAQARARGSGRFPMGGDPFREQPSLDRDEPRATDARSAVPNETGMYRTPHGPVAVHFY